jgi:hypothetical protein
MTDPERWRTLWKTVVDLGWTELATPDGDFGIVDRVVVLEEGGAAIAPIPLLSSVGLAAGVLRSSGPAGDGPLSEIADGAVATLAVHPPGQRLPGVPMTLQGGRLRGRAIAVPDVSRAELIVTLATADDGVVAAVVRGGDGIRVQPAVCTDPGQPVADVEIDTKPPWWTSNLLWLPHWSLRPPTSSALPVQPWPARSSMRSRGSSSASRSAPFKGSSTHWPTTTSVWSAPAA